MIFASTSVGRHVDAICPPGDILPKFYVRDAMKIICATGENMKVILTIFYLELHHEEHWVY